jgi:hypothetical protein
LVLIPADFSAAAAVHIFSFCPSQPQALPVLVQQTCKILIVHVSPVLKAQKLFL